MREPWTHPSQVGAWRFGAKLAKTAGDREAAIGFAAVRMDKGKVGRIPIPGTEGFAENVDDPVAELIAQYKKMAFELGPGEGVTLYRYGDAEAFRDTRPDRDGMTRTGHWRTIDVAAARIRAEGIDVEVVTIRTPEDRR